MCYHIRRIMWHYGLLAGYIKRKGDYKMKQLLKKLMAFLLATVLVFSLCPTTVLAEGETEPSETTNAPAAMTSEEPSKELTVGKDTLYPTIQEAVNHIALQEDKTGWTITVQAGSYDRFTVLNGLDGLTVRAAEGAAVTIKVCSGGQSPAEVSGAYPDTAGVSIREADGVTLGGLTFDMGTQSDPWVSAAVSNYTESSKKGNGIIVTGCAFLGYGSNVGVFINTGTTRFQVTGCSFSGMKEAVSMYGDGTLVQEAAVTGNTFTACSFALHGYYGGTGEAGTLTFADNTVTGGDTYCKIVIQDQNNTGALKADIHGNTLTNAIVGLVNLREDGENVSEVLTDNTFCDNSFYVEAVEPGTIDFYTSYQAPANGEGYWKLTGKEDFEVDWGKNPDGSAARIEELVQDANAAGSRTLNITGIDENNLIKTFTWFKDGLYWVTGEQPKPIVPPELPDSEWEVSRSKTATNLDRNYQSEVTLSLPSAEEQLVTDVVFVLDESSCSEPVKAEVSGMLEELYAQVDSTGATIRIGAVQFRGEVTSLPLTELTADTKDAVTAFMSARPATGGSNMSAGLLAGEAMLDADTAVSAERKYLILVSDGITYIWDDETTAAQENYGVNFANGDTPNTPMLAGPDGWDVKYGNGFVPGDWKAQLDTIGQLLNKTIQEKASAYVRGSDLSDKPFVSYGEKDRYVSTVDIALYKSYLAYQRIASKYAHTYVVMAGVESEMSTYPFGPSFMNYLANGKTASFAGILNEIIYLVDAGSYVKDYIGYVADDYDFDFVNEASAMTLKVGDQSYEAVKLGENQYGFKPIGNGYAYTVTYVRGDGKGEEHFVWEINEAVTNFAPVQLTYTVKLTNPKTEAGTYGVYDADGSNADAKALYTNNSASLYPVDSNGTPGSAQEFPKPTVSYTVDEPEPPVTDPTPTGPEPTEPEPSQPSEPSEPSKPAEPTKPAEPDAPKTGDETNAVMMLAVMGVSLLGIALLAFLLLKKNYSGKYLK